jgi:hypothetical protein
MLRFGHNKISHMGEPCRRKLNTGPYVELVALPSPSSSRMRKK